MPYKQLHIGSHTDLIWCTHLSLCTCYKTTVCRIYIHIFCTPGILEMEFFLAHSLLPCKYKNLCDMVVWQSLGHVKMLQVKHINLNIFLTRSGCLFVMIVSEKVVSPTGWNNGSQFGKWFSYMIACNLLVSRLSYGFMNVEVYLQWNSLRPLLCLFDCLIYLHPHASIWSWHKWIILEILTHITKQWWSNETLWPPTWHVQQQVTTPLLFRAIPAVHKLGLLMRWLPPDPNPNEVGICMILYTISMHYAVLIEVDFFLKSLRTWITGSGSIKYYL